MTRGGMYYFQLMSRDEQEAAIGRLLASGLSEATVAAATGLSIEAIKQLLNTDCLGCGVKTNDAEGVCADCRHTDGKYGTKVLLEVVNDE